MSEVTPLSPAALMPRRNAGLVQRLARRLFVADPAYGPQPEMTNTTQSGVMSQVISSIYDMYFQALDERLAIYKDVDEMDSVSPEFSAAMDAIADNITASEDGSQDACVVECEDDKVKDRLNALLRNIGIDKAAYAWARQGIKKGDLFLEPVINEAGDIVAVRMLPPETMHRNEDRKGNLLVAEPKYDEATGACLNRKDECAFEQRSLEDAEVLATWYPWGIIHGRWNWDGYSRYGRSHGKVSRVDWRKLKASEEALIIGRLVRSFLKLAFYIDTTGLSQDQKKEAVRNFQEAITKRQQIDGKRENPFYVLTDFFIADGHYRMGQEVVQSRTRVESIDPKNDGLTHIDDIKYFHRKYLATLRVPPSYLAFEDAQPAGGTVGMQDINFVRFVRRGQKFLSSISAQLCALQLLIDGYDLDNMPEFSFVWPALSTADEAAAAQADFQRAQANAIGLGTSSLNQTAYLSREWVMKHTYGMSDQEIREVLAQIEDERGRQVDEQTTMLKFKADLDAQAQANKQGRPEDVTDSPDNASKPKGTAGRADMRAKQKQGSDTSETEIANKNKPGAVRQDVADVGSLIRQMQLRDEGNRKVLLASIDAIRTAAQRPVEVTVLAPTAPNTEEG